VQKFHNNAVPSSVLEIHYQSLGCRVLVAFFITKYYVVLELDAAQWLCFVHRGFMFFVVEQRGFGCIFMPGI
jgi:hypothetical protein